MRVMQGIDLAVQKAHGLADFLEGIGDRLEPDQLIDISTALNVITLEDMKRRLAPRSMKRRLQRPTRKPLATWISSDPAGQTGPADHLRTSFAA
jgi:hypothetical protein